VSRRKDRVRYESMKRLNPDYRGFRGHGLEPDVPGQMPLQSVICSVCGRKRNVPLGVAVEQEGQYVCQSCQEEGRR
jgi:formylmethanofuran dehydrogenase subunit E